MPSDRDDPTVDRNAAAGQFMIDVDSAGRRTVVPRAAGCPRCCGPAAGPAAVAAISSRVGGIRRLHAQFGPRRCLHRQTHVNIEGEPTRAEWFVLGMVVLVLPIASLVGWFVSRISTVRGRTLAATVALMVAIAAGIVGGPSPRVLVDLLFEAIVIAVVLALTASGFGRSWPGPRR